MKFIDTHLHLDSEAFDKDRMEVIEASRERGVSRWINVGYNPARWETTAHLAASVEGMSCMIGLHPGDADAWNDDLAQSLRHNIATLHPVAIGETGLDLHWRQDNLPVQIEAFRAQLRLAHEFDVPAVIHMRAADDVLLQVLCGEENLPHLHFHSFDGGEALRDWVSRHGATIGIGGLLTRKGSEGLQHWVRTFPRDRVVLETDAPYLKPRGIRGRRNEPAYLVKVAEVISQLWDVGLDDVAKLTTANAIQLFGLDKERH